MTERIALYCLVDKSTYEGCEGPYFLDPYQAIFCGLLKFMSEKKGLPEISLAKTVIPNVQWKAGSYPFDKTIVFVNEQLVLLCGFLADGIILPDAVHKSGGFEFKSVIKTKESVMMNSIQYDSNNYAGSINNKNNTPSNTITKVTTAYLFSVNVFSNTSWIVTAKDNITNAGSIMLVTDTFSSLSRLLINSLPIKTESGISTVGATKVLNDGSYINKAVEFYSDTAYRVKSWSNSLVDKRLYPIDWEDSWMRLLLCAQSNKSVIGCKSSFISSGGTSIVSLGKLPISTFNNIMIPDILYMLNKDVLGILFSHITNIRDIISFSMTCKTYHRLLTSRPIMLVLRKNFLSSINKSFGFDFKSILSKSSDEFREKLIVAIIRTGFITFPRVVNGKLSIGSVLFDEDFTDINSITYLKCQDGLVEIIDWFSLISRCNSFCCMLMSMIISLSIVGEAVVKIQSSTSIDPTAFSRIWHQIRMENKDIANNGEDESATDADKMSFIVDRDFVLTHLTQKKSTDYKYEDPGMIEDEYVRGINSIQTRGGPYYIITPNKLFLVKNYTTTLNKFKTTQLQRHQILIYKNQNPTISLPKLYNHVLNMVLFSKLILRNANDDIIGLFVFSVGLSSKESYIIVKDPENIMLLDRYMHTANIRTFIISRDNSRKQMFSDAGVNVIDQNLIGHTCINLNANLTSLTRYAMIYMMYVYYIRRCILVDKSIKAEWVTNFFGE